MLHTFVPLLVAITSVTLAAAQSQTVHIDLYDAASGHAITGATVTMSIVNNDRIVEQAAKADGSSYELPIVGQSIVDLATVRVGSEHWYDRAPCLQCVHQKPHYEASVIMKEGIVTENTCSDRPSKLQPKAGHIAFFVRPLTFHEKLSRFFDEVKSE